MEEPFGIHPWTNGNHCVPLSQMGKRVGLQAHQGIVGVHRESYCVRFAYEWREDSGHWYRSYGNEAWKFNEDGLMATRLASINDLPISESDRKYHWPLGRRPDNHQGLSDLGL